MKRTSLSRGFVSRRYISRNFSFKKIFLLRRYFPLREDYSLLRIQRLSFEKIISLSKRLFITPGPSKLEKVVDLSSPLPEIEVHYLNLDQFSQLNSTPGSTTFSKLDNPGVMLKCGDKTTSLVLV